MGEIYNSRKIVDLMEWEGNQQGYND